jgi:hypothetical protein
MAATRMRLFIEHAPVRLLRGSKGDGSFTPGPFGAARMEQDVSARRAGQSAPVFARDGAAVVEVTLCRRQTLRLGFDLIQLATAPAFRLGPPPTEFRARGRQPRRRGNAGFI